MLTRTFRTKSNGYSSGNVNMKFLEYDAFVALTYSHMVVSKIALDKYKIILV